MKELLEDSVSIDYHHPSIQKWSDNSIYAHVGQELYLGDFLKSEIIQNLWSGYGVLVRVHYEKSSIIIKHVKLPKKSEHPKGWNSNLSHQRKIHSYDVEVNWYQNYAKTIDAHCPTAKVLKSIKNNNEWFIVMQDLSTIGLNKVVQEANEKHIQSCLSWLAYFHAKYLNSQSELLWKTGTYWHLQTRPDEFNALKDDKLKTYAKILDDSLNHCCYQTIVHGDAKLANFCFNEDGSKCAAVDFQYVGQGCGIKDVIYFMSSAIAVEQCQSMEEWVLSTYFTALHEALKVYHPSVNAVEVEKEWRSLYSFAWADFVRFLKGWSPNHYKINDYSQTVTQKALRELERLKKDV